MTRQDFFSLCARARGQLRVIYTPPTLHWQTMGLLHLWASQGFRGDRSVVLAPWSHRSQLIKSVRRENAGREQCKYEKWLHQWQNGGGK